MNQPMNQPLGENTSSESDRRISRSRRALLRAGAASAPVLLTVASKPVSATGLTPCVVASSFVSVATFKSRNPGVKTIQCTSGTGLPEAFIAECKSKPDAAPYTQLVSERLGHTSSQYNGKTIGYALTCAGSSPQLSGELGVLQHLLSMSLALEKGLVTMPGNMSQGYLCGVWANFNANMCVKYEAPFSGVSWNSSQVVTWLRLSMYTNPSW